MLPFLRHHPLAVFVSLTYAFSWLCWLPVLDRVQSNPFKSDPDVILRLLLGGWGPTLSALLLGGLTGGWAGVRSLLARCKPRGIRPSTLLLALAWNPVVAVIAVGGYIVAGGEFGYIHWPALLWVPVMFIAVSIFGPLGEELGWRGVALPELLRTLSPARASLLLGVIWTFWHTPLMWAAAGTSISGQPVTLLNIAAYLASVTASSFIFTWLHLRGRGNVLVAVLAHVSLNGTSVALGFLLPELGAGSHVLWLFSSAVTAAMALALGPTLRQLRGAAADSAAPVSA